jgi:hypothetical protein
VLLIRDSLGHPRVMAAGECEAAGEGLYYQGASASFLGLGGSNHRRVLRISFGA